MGLREWKPGTVHDVPIRETEGSPRKLAHNVWTLRTDSGKTLQRHVCVGTTAFPKKGTNTCPSLTHTPTRPSLRGRVLRLPTHTPAHKAASQPPNAWSPGAAHVRLRVVARRVGGEHEAAAEVAVLEGRARGGGERVVDRRGQREERLLETLGGLAAGHVARPGTSRILDSSDCVGELQRPSGSP